MEYLRVGTPDSTSPARLYWGEYTPTGFLDDHLSVAVEQPSIAAGNTQHSRFDGSVTLVEILDFSEQGDRVIGVPY